MNFSVSRNGQIIGEYTSAQLEQGMLAETIFPTDLVWAAGMSGWLPVSQVLGNPAMLNPGYPLHPQGLAPFPPHISQTSGLAVASLVLGLASIFLWCTTGIPAIILGHVAHSQIKHSGGRLTGAGMAIAGYVLGYVFTVGVIALYLSLIGVGVAAIPFFEKITEQAEVAQQLHSAQELINACKTYAASHQGELPGDLEDLVKEHLVTEALLTEATNSKVSTWTGDPGFTYLGAGMKDSDESSSIVFKSNDHDAKGQRVVAHLSGAVNETLSE